MLLLPLSISAISVLRNLMNLIQRIIITSRCCKILTLLAKNMMQKIVCDTDNMECMVQDCEQCPRFNNLQTYLEGKFSAFEFDDDIIYSQWDSTDSTELRNYTTSVEEFIGLLLHQMDILTTHSCVAKSQVRYWNKQ